MRKDSMVYFMIDIRPAYENWTAFDLVIRSEEIKQTGSELEDLLFFVSSYLYSCNSVYIRCQISTLQKGNYLCI